MTQAIHQTIPMQVWADIDVGIADMVRHLNTIPGVRTYTSCQGTLGELSEADKRDGAEESRAWVMVSWEDDAALARIRADYDLDIIGVPWGYAHPRQA